MLAIRKSVKVAFNEIAESYDRLRAKPWPPLVKFIELEKFFHNISKDTLILDVGCGNGRHSILCANLGFRAIGIDLSPKLLKMAKQRIKKFNLPEKVNLILGDALSLPLREKLFKRLLFIATLHHIPSSKARLQCLLELKRVLTNDGKALITVWRKWQPKFMGYFIKDFFKKIFRLSNGEFGDIYVSWRLGTKEIQRFYHLFSKKEFVKLLQKSGFIIEKISSEDIEKIRIKRNFFAIVKHSAPNQ
ncbi:MAG: class I SAM-dependent methyltransferase [Candidatus Baldrarchaeia archaeon]